MQSHQFESYEAAMKYLNERGTPTYWGWEGEDYEVKKVRGGLRWITKISRFKN